MLRGVCRSVGAPGILTARAARAVGAAAGLPRQSFLGMDTHAMLARAHGSIPHDPNAEMIEFSFKLRDGSSKTVSVPEGTSVLEAAHANAVDLEGACEASLACSTCHVILPQDVYDEIEEADDTEDDLLDVCPGLTSTSRLGCQVIVDDILRGREVELPQMTLNFYVDGHVPTPH